MTTPNEFKTRHNLTDSAFKHLVNSVKATHPNLAPFTTRVNSKVWRVNHEQVLEAHLFGDDDRRTTSDVLPTDPLNSAIGRLTLKLTQAKPVSDIEVVDAELVELPTTASDLLATRHSELVASQQQSQTLSVVIDATIERLLDLQRQRDEQARERDRIDRINRIKAAELDETLRIQEELQARQRVRDLHDNGAGLNARTASQLERISKAL